MRINPIYIQCHTGIGLIYYVCPCFSYLPKHSWELLSAWIAILEVGVGAAVVESALTYCTVHAHLYGDITQRELH